MVGGKKEMKVYASKAVVSNADPKVTLGLLEAHLAKRTAAGTASEVRKAQEAADYLKGIMSDFEDLDSFIHLHAGIDGAGLPTQSSEEFPAQWAVVNDWNKEGGVEAPRNLVLVSMPSLIDPSLAPQGKHVIHAYTPATELYADWAGLDRQSDAYKRKKAEAEDFLWKQVERVVPNARGRAEIRMVGTPLTHQRFLRRKSGTYGPRVVAGKQSLPGHKTPLDGLYVCGDFTYPGIGVPATASSGAVTANSIVSVPEHLSLLDKVRLPKN
jgi:phytoene dehydrogenase-like protein